MVAAFLYVYIWLLIKLNILIQYILAIRAETVSIFLIAESLVLRRVSDIQKAPNKYF